jgi:hypothetical protein
MRISVCAVLVALGAAIGSCAGWAEEARLADLYRNATPILDVRYRFELVDQDGFGRDARANTVRTRFGFETGKVAGFGLGVDAEWIESIGAEEFNSTTNRRTAYPTVADPDDLALNRLFLISDGTIPDTVAWLGRQRVIWDNSRFIGNVGFRQNEQTFDAFRLTTRALPGIEIEYAYLQEVHRIFGTDSPVGRLKMDSHAMRAKFGILGWADVVPFALLLDFDRPDQAANSSASYGALVSGKRELAPGWNLSYSAALARQQDDGQNPNEVDLWYYAIEPGIAWKGVSAQLGYEVLEGDGTIGFRTPVATLHKFNGFTDQFLTTPADGLEDVNLKLAAKLPPGGWAGGVEIKANWHEFFNEENGSHYGREWNLGVFRTFAMAHGDLALGLQYADYDADEFAADVEKLWFTVQFALSPEAYRKAVRGSAK